MRTTLCLIIFTAFLISGYGQNSDIPDTQEDKTLLANEGLFRIGLTPSAMFNIYPALQMNGAVNVSDHFQFNIEAGYVFYSLTSIEPSISGYRIRPALRHNVIREKKHQLHFTLAYNIRKTTSIRIEEFRILGENRSEIAEFEHDKSLKGLVTMIGLDVKISENFIIDFGLGLGIGTLNVEDRNIPEHGRRVLLPDEEYDAQGEYNLPITIVNLRIQYLL